MSAEPPPTGGPSSEPEDEPRNVDLTVQLDHFGPVTSANTTLRPLTVFAGPNGVGKSYAALAIHALLGALGLGDPGHDYSRTSMAALASHWGPACAAAGIEARGLDEWLADVAEKVALSGNLEGANAIPALATAARMLDALPDRLRALYQAPPQALRQRGGSMSRMHLRAGPLDVDIPVTEGGIDLPRATTGGPVLGRLTSDIAVLTGPHLASHASDVTDEAGGPVRAELLRYLLAATEAALARCVPARRWYLPAGRCGLMAARETIVGRLIQRASMLPLSGADIPRLPGAIAELLAHLSTSPPERSVEPDGRSALRDLAEQAELEALGGSIRVRRESRRGPGIFFEQQGEAIDVVRASSSVGEFAPISIYLKELVQPGDLLVIEEPEAHMHPENQRVLARLFVRLVRAGVYVLLTTHSDYLLEQLSGLAIAHNLPKAERARLLGDNQDATIAPEDLGVYLFEWTQKADRAAGATVRRLEVTRKEGIPPEYFEDVEEALYNESVEIRSAAQGD